MGAPLQPQKWRVEECHTACSLNPRNLPLGFYDKIHQAYEAGWSKQRIVALSDELGHHLSEGAVANHKRKHMRPEASFVPVGELPEDQKKLTDLEILDRIIQAGARGLQSAGVRISPEMTMKAMDLRLRLTQGSVHDDFMNAIANAFGGGETPERPKAPENIAAMLGADEASQAGDDSDDG